MSHDVRRRAIGRPEDDTQRGRQAIRSPSGSAGLGRATIVADGNSLDAIALGGRHHAHAPPGHRIARERRRRGHPLVRPAHLRPSEVASEGLPIVIELVDTKERVDGAVPKIEAVMADRGVV